MKKTDIRKLAAAAMLVAVAVICSPLSIPVGASKCFPIQHLVNVIAGVFLGPWYAVGAAFCTSLIRNLLGTGSLLAFPGSMSVIGGLLCYPVALFLMGNSEAALFGYVLPFFVSSLGGTIIAIVLVTIMKKVKVFDRFFSAA